MKNLNTVSIVIAFIAIVISGYCLYTTKSSKKQAYIELQKVFNEFEMTKQYKLKLESVVNARKSIADSIELDLTAQARVLKQTAKPASDKLQDFMYEKEMYMEKVMQFEQDNMALKQKYDAEINRQLNQYIKDYGLKNGYEFIYGADGSGALMYAKESANISPEITEYINKRYKGEPR